MPRRFTLAEARRLLPKVDPLVREAIDVKAEYQEAERGVQSLHTQVMLMGGMVVDRGRALQARAGRERAAQKLKDAIGRIQEIGCEVKDLDTGLIDFRTLFHGREVYLCWKLGEPDIAFWHGLEDGFRGRQPIDQDFLDNHHGDRPQ